MNSYCPRCAQAREVQVGQPCGYVLQHGDYCPRCGTKNTGPPDNTCDNCGFSSCEHPTIALETIESIRKIETILEENYRSEVGKVAEYEYQLSQAVARRDNEKSHLDALAADFPKPVRPIEEE